MEAEKVLKQKQLAHSKSASHEAFLQRKSKLKESSLTKKKHRNLREVLVKSRYKEGIFVQDELQDV
jgi:hypothetical protein